MDATACEKDTRKIKVEQNACMGTFWFIGWLFTIGFLQLAFWRGLLALVLWPYDLGAHFSPFVR